MAKQDIPVENPNKYGRFDDVEENDRNDISNLLGGGTGAGIRGVSRSDDDASDSGETLEDILREAGNSNTKYGR